MENLLIILEIIFGAILVTIYLILVFFLLFLYLLPIIPLLFLWVILIKIDDEEDGSWWWILRWGIFVGVSLLYVELFPLIDRAGARWVGDEFTSFTYFTISGIVERIFPGFGQYFTLYGIDVPLLRSAIIVGFVVQLLRRTPRTIKAIQQAKDERRDSLIYQCERSIDLIESMSRKLVVAKVYLDDAESQFTRREVAPFWDSIEEATECLAQFNDCIRAIDGASDRFRREAQEYIDTYGDNPPTFPDLTQIPDKLSVGKLIAKRMQENVSAAQCYFEFSSIFESRKTNKILIAGFSTLSDTMNQMDLEIGRAINNLTNSVDSMSDVVEKHQKEVSNAEQARAEREKKALEMLDNITG